MVSPVGTKMIIRPRKRKKLLLVGSRIRKLRKERSQTQLALASKVGIQQSDLCRMETGEYKVSLETLFNILSVFEMNIAEFFHEELAQEHSGEESEFLSLFRQLEREDQQEVTDFLRFKVHQNGKGEEEEEAVAPTSPEVEQESG
jgi:transcriptional regulator with XRE-family HTH domain